jgi:hypothetical protein
MGSMTMAFLTFEVVNHKICILIGALFYRGMGIENIIQEFLEVGVVCPSIISYSSLVIMVLKKESTHHMCSDFWALAII